MYDSIMEMRNNIGAEGAPPPVAAPAPAPTAPAPASVAGAATATSSPSHPPSPSSSGGGGRGVASTRGVTRGRGAAGTARGGRGRQQAAAQERERERQREARTRESIKGALGDLLVDGGKTESPALKSKLRKQAAEIHYPKDKKALYKRYLHETKALAAEEAKARAVGGTG